ncbi:MAG: ComEC/Rec2 family competence protein, partial [Eggerthellaceae bacterium]
AAASVMIGTVVVAPRLSGDEIVMLDVGQGDAFLVRSRGTAVLIDTGNQDRMLREALARHGAYRLDAVVITHGDYDHKGSLASLAGVVDVRRVLVARTLSCGCEACVSLVADARKLAGDGESSASAGDALRVGSFDLRQLRAVLRRRERADSLCLVADADIDGDSASSGVRFSRETPSATAARAHRRRACGLRRPLQVVSRIKSALDDEEAAVLSPRIALVSAGARNRYGHPEDRSIGSRPRAPRLPAPTAGRCFVQRPPTGSGGTLR